MNAHVHPKCCSYLPGHTTHYIAPLRAYARTQRDPITVINADADGWITFRDQESEELRWWHHDAARVIAIRESGVQFVRVRGSRFLVAQASKDGFAWLYCSETPSPCVTEHSADLIDAMKNEGGFIVSLPRDAAARHALAHTIAAGIIAEINACRLAAGLPPLKRRTERCPS